MEKLAFFAGLVGRGCFADGVAFMATTDTAGPPRGGRTFFNTKDCSAKKEDQDLNVDDSD